eukprot:CAMPEP_0175718650 /NCGR_PEP_ID=MMETSP0097-20121207/44279_1 /TAXON_ID=311494 /ORGANISM="Alexandrium monilatum, Strain CCMP3105" /LENGTH=326 /DNA_ID=CAMNT_0017026251 /DNA_START=1 /DNA_END=978 /DNA_ORIENTATION=-
MRLQSLSQGSLSDTGPVRGVEGACSRGLSVNELRSIVQGRARQQLLSPSSASPGVSMPLLQEPPPRFPADMCPLQRPRRRRGGAQAGKPMPLHSAESAPASRSSSHTGTHPGGRLGSRRCSRLATRLNSLMPAAFGAVTAGEDGILDEPVAFEDETAPRPRRTNRRKRTSSRRRVNSAQVVRKSPFVGCDSREASLAQERKWLREDELYLLERTEDLRHASVMKQLAERCASREDMYEKRIFFGPISLKIKASKSAKVAKVKPAEGKPAETAGTEAGRAKRATTAQHRSATNAMKKLQQELEVSAKSLKPTYRGRSPRGMKEWRLH